MVMCTPNVPRDCGLQGLIAGGSGVPHENKHVYKLPLRTLSFEHGTGPAANQTLSGLIDRIEVLTLQSKTFVVK
jgi:hypothetical protein